MKASYSKHLSLNALYEDYIPLVKRVETFRKFSGNWRVSRTVSLTPTLKSKATALINRSLYLGS